MICDREALYGLDVSMFALFAIATIIVFIAFHTPTLAVIEEMTEEELEGTEIKAR